jgi:hypothetical protein
VAKSSLQVGQHAAYSIGIHFTDNRNLGKISATSWAFVSEQVAFESLAAHNFAGAAGAKPLSGSAAGFEFRHDLS